MLFDFTTNLAKSYNYNKRTDHNLQKVHLTFFYPFKPFELN